MTPELPQFEARPIPRWQKLTAIAYVIATVAVLVAFHARLRADFWPLDAARISPNIVATIIQIAIATPAAVLLWPPTRRRIHRFVTTHTAPLHAHFDRLHEQRERHHAEQMAKLDAIHKHVRVTHPLP